MVDCPSADGLVLRRPMTIFRFGRDLRADALPKTSFSMLFNVVGKGTTWLSGCRRGERLDVIGPLGNGFSPSPTSKRLLMVAGGIGVAGVAALADRAAQKDKEVRLLLGLRGSANTYPKEVIPQIVEVHLSTEDGSLGKKGFVTDLLAEHVPWSDEVFACGPNAMFHSMAGVWEKSRYGQPAQVLLEARMGCGLGLCYACAIPTKTGFLRVCTNGPRFNLQEVDWQLLKSMLSRPGDGKWL